MTAWTPVASRRAERLRTSAGASIPCSSTREELEDEAVDDEQLYILTSWEANYCWWLEYQGRSWYVVGIGDAGGHWQTETSSIRYEQTLILFMEERVVMSCRRCCCRIACLILMGMFVRYNAWAFMLTCTFSSMSYKVPNPEHSGEEKCLYRSGLVWRVW